MKNLRMAVIGAGRLGGFHAQKLAAHPNVDLAAVVDPIAEQRDRVARECNTLAVTDLSELSDKIDAAVIAAPTGLHHRLAVDLLEKGVHLLVEKPICNRLAEADELVALARRNRLILQVGHVERFNPAWTAAKGEIDDPKYIEAVRNSGFTFRCTDVGVVLDLMIHDIDLVLSMTGSSVCRVEAMGLSVLGGHEDVANARLYFESGCIAALSASRVSREPARRMSVLSPEAMAHLDFASRTVEITRPSETLLRREFDIETLSAERVEHYKEHLLDEHLPRRRAAFDAVDALALQTEDFIGSVRESRSPRVSGRAGRDAVAVAEEVLGCIDHHAWDNRPGGRVGPAVTSQRQIIPVPHFLPPPAETTPSRDPRTATERRA